MGVAQVLMRGAGSPLLTCIIVHTFCLILEYMLLPVWLLHYQNYLICYYTLLTLSPHKHIHTGHLLRRCRVLSSLQMDASTWCLRVAVTGV